LQNNPNLSGLAEILCEAGSDLYVVSPRITELYQQPPTPGVTMHLFEGLIRVHITGRVLADSTGAGAPPALFSFVERSGPFDRVVGIDRGVIEVARSRGSTTIAA
jgi:hypothetical protein